MDSFIDFLKKNKIFLTIAAIFVFSLVAVTACKAMMPRTDLKPSDYDLGMTYENAKKDDNPIIAVFYVDWCTYCQRFMPRLDKVRNINKDKFNVVLINVEEPQNVKIAKEYRIASYPTAYIIDPAYDNRVHIDNTYMETVSDLNKEVSRYYNFRKLVKKGESCKQN